MAKTYFTVQGDTWDSIALKFYNNEKLMHCLLKANPKHLKTVVFSANVQLNIPKVDVSIIGTNINLPSWRR